MAGISDSTAVDDSDVSSSDANRRSALSGASSQIPSLEFVHPVLGYAVRMDDNGIGLSKSGWSASLRVAQVGTAGQMQPVLPAEPVLHHDLVEWDHGAMSSWIAADHGTLEQGFALQQRPEGDGEVRITLDLETSLRPEVFADGACIVMRDPLGVPVLAYENLFVYDGRGRTLAAEMSLDPHGDIVIAVDDRGAEYPITVDPDLTDVSDGGVSQCCSVKMAGFFVLKVFLFHLEFGDLAIRGNERPGRFLWRNFHTQTPGVDRIIRSSWA
jgi:hypothetical protein